MRFLSCVFLLSAVLTLPVRDAQAWRQGGVLLVGDPARPVNSDQLCVIPDLAGGLGAVWIDSRTANDALWSQCVSASGFREWTPGGIERVPLAAGEEAFLIPSSRSTFLVRRAPGANWRLSPLRPDGLPRTDYPAGGLDVSTLEGASMIAVAELPEVACTGAPDPVTCSVTSLVGLVSDPVGATPGEVRLQIWTGNPGEHYVWPAAGMLVANIPGEFDALQVVAARGLYGWAVWETKPANGQAAGIFVVRADLSADGGGGHFPAGWSFGGLQVAATSPTFVKAFVDDADGLFVVWKRPSTLGWKTFAQHVLPNGMLAAGWPAAGLELGYSLDPFGVDAASDSLGGFYLTSVDVSTADPLVSELRVRRIGGDGSAAPGWPADGILLGTGHDVHASLHRAGAGGFHAVLQRDPAAGPGTGLRLLRRTATSETAPGWPEGGVVVTDSPTALHPQVISDGADGVIVAWTEFVTRDLEAPVTQLHAQRFGPGSAPTPQEPPAAPSLGAARPQPSNGAVRLSLRLAADARAEVLIVDVRGRRVRAMAPLELQAGAQELTWDGRDDDGHDVESGVYFARVNVGGRVTQHRIVRVN